MRLDFKEIEEHLDMEFFLERESIPYRESRGVNGMQLNIKTCPSCGDKRYRTYFGLETDRGNCFVCNTGFNKVSFIHAYLDTGVWSDTLRHCGELLKEQGWRPKRKQMVIVEQNEVNLPYSESLPLDTGENLQYLVNRGFNDDITRYFNLRWCEFGWWQYKDIDGTNKTQEFSNRIIIPITDLDGTIKTFQGRDITGASDRKYLFPKLLPGTGRYLFNGHNVVATDHAVMGEGVFDVAAIKMALDDDVSLRHIVAVGSFGKHLSYGNSSGDDQLGRFLGLKSRGLKTVTIMWDGEAAALTSALSAAKLLRSIGLTARIALLPKGRDPNEVTGDVVRDAFYKAEIWSPKLDIKLRLRNPYA